MTKSVIFESFKTIGGKVKQNDVLTEPVKNRETRRYI